MSLSLKPGRDDFHVPDQDPELTHVRNSTPANAADQSPFTNHAALSLRLSVLWMTKHF